VGTDGHPYIEVKGKNGRWGLRDDEERYWRQRDRDKLSYEEMDALKSYPIRILGQRNYRLFGILSDVRNHEFTPLFPQRDCPDDMSKAVGNLINDGDNHSHTYFTLQELMDVAWDSLCAVMEYALLADEYLLWKETGRRPAGAEELCYMGQRSADPFHRPVEEQEMILLLTAGGPEPLVRKLKGTWQRKKKKIRGGPYVGMSVPVSYKELVPELHECIEHLAKLGPPDRVRVIIAYDN